MNRTALAVIALAVILGIAGYLFFASSPETDTTLDQNVDQMTAPPGADTPPPVEPAPPAAEPAPATTP